MIFAATSTAVAPPFASFQRVEMVWNKTASLMLPPVLDPQIVAILGILNNLYWEPSTPKGEAMLGGAPLVFEGASDEAWFKQIDLELLRERLPGVILPMSPLLSNAPPLQLEVTSGNMSFGIPVIAATTSTASAAETDTHEVPAWFEPLIYRVDRFSLLPKNWDTYNGKQISNRVILRAVHIAVLLSDIMSQQRLTLTESPFAAPTSSGGVLFEIKNRDRELHVEIDANDSQHYRISRFSTAPSFQESEEDESINESQLREALSWIVRADS